MPEHFATSTACRPPAPRRWQRLCWALLGAGLIWGAAPAWSQTGATAASPQLLQAWTQQVRAWLHHHLAQLPTPAPGLRPEFDVGQLDARLRLAPCQQVQPYLPTGTRLWGRSRVGLRCVQGPAQWNVFLPVTVRMWGPAWRVAHPIAPGQRLSPSDLEPTEIDWAQHLSPVLYQTADWQGLQATRQLVPGQVLRQGMVKPPEVFSAGTQVKVRVRGAQFELAATGSALSAGLLGHTARVRLPNRKVISGKVIDAETVEVTL